MRIGWVILCAGLGSSMAAQAEDMKTLTGQIYSNVVVRSYDREGYLIRHDGGTNLVPYSEISAELRGHYKALSLAPIPASRLAGEKEAPAGPDDLETLAGQIYRNVAVKKVGEDAILIAHDTGMATVSFAAIPRDQHEKYRTAQAVPDPEPGANDLVTAYGQIFRNVEITLEEPDGLTFRHAGGTSKVGFLALPEEVRQKYNYDPVAGWKYARDRAAQKALKELAAEPESQGPTLVEVANLLAEAMPDSVYRVSFSVKNLTAQARSVTATVRDAKRTALISRPIEIAANSGSKLLQIEVPTIQPKDLLVVCGAYRTNCVLNW